MNFTGSVLIIDDEEHIRKFVTLIVRALGATRVLETGNGNDALAIYERERPDIVLLDVNMPQIDGLEVLKRLKAIDPDSVVIMLTSLANRHTVEQALELGAANYIRKDTPKEEISKSLAGTISECFETEDPAP